MFTVNVPRFPLPLLAPMLTVAEPLPIMLAGVTEIFRLFPIPAITAVMVRVPLPFCMVYVTARVPWPLWLRDRDEGLTDAVHGTGVAVAVGVAGGSGVAVGVAVGVGVGVL